MIHINDNDLPITVAQKIINGTRPSDASPLEKCLAQAITKNPCNTMDMFSLEDIKEIADYLMVYYNCHHSGD